VRIEPPDAKSSSRLVWRLIENRIAALDPNLESYGSACGLEDGARELLITLMSVPGEYHWKGAYGTLWWADGAPGSSGGGSAAADQSAGLPGADKIPGPRAIKPRCATLSLRDAVMRNRLF
jgi:hypothetical protein